MLLQDLETVISRTSRNTNKNEIIVHHLQPLSIVSVYKANSMSKVDVYIYFSRVILSTVTVCVEFYHHFGLSDFHSQTTLNVSCFQVLDHGLNFFEVFCNDHNVIS